jgi:hypothetical protein
MSETLSNNHTHIHSITPEIPDAKTLQKHKFIMTALEMGWSIKKRNDKYILSKKHEGKSEVFMDDYLEKIINKML